MPPATRPSSATDWVALGVFAQPHGVSGRIKVKSFTDTPDDFANHPTLTDEHGTPIKLRITGHTQGMAIVTVDGITKREQAELLRGRKIGVARATLPVLEKPNQFYIHDLIGMEVITLSGTPFGTVQDVMNYGAGDILEIKQTDGKLEMYAFTHATFPTVDTATRHITIDPPSILGLEDKENA